MLIYINVSYAEQLTTKASISALLQKAYSLSSHHSLMLEIDKKKLLFNSNNAFNKFLLGLFDNKIIQLMQTKKRSLELNPDIGRMNILSLKKNLFTISLPAELIFYNKSLSTKVPIYINASLVQKGDNYLIQSVILHRKLVCEISSKHQNKSKISQLKKELKKTTLMLFRYNYQNTNHHLSKVMKSFSPMTKYFDYYDNVEKLIIKRMEEKRYHLHLALSPSSDNIKLCHVDKNQWNARMKGTLIFSNERLKERITVIIDAKLKVQKNDQIKFKKLSLTATL